MAVVSAALMSAIAFVSAAAAMGLLCLRSRMSLWRRSLRMWLRGGARRFHMLLRLRHLAVFHAGSFHARLWLWLRLPSIFKTRLRDIGLWLRAVLETGVCAVGLWLRLCSILKPWVRTIGLWLRLPSILETGVCAVGLWLRLCSVLETGVRAIGLWLRLRAVLKPWVCAIGLWLRLP